MAASTDPTSYLEVHTPGGREIVLLDRDQVTIGRRQGNRVELGFDSTVSSLHAVVQSYGTGWCVRDLGSTNGTTVAGGRLMAEQVLRDGDEIRIGRTRLTFRSGGPATVTETVSPVRPPEVTRRERDVLVALCRPLFSNDVFREPSSLRDIAAALVVTEAAVKQHLLRLYDKFGLDPDSHRRRIELANEAINRGVLTPADLKTHPPAPR